MKIENYLKAKEAESARDATAKQSEYKCSSIKKSSVDRLAKVIEKYFATGNSDPFRYSVDDFCKAAIGGVEEYKKSIADAESVFASETKQIEADFRAAMAKL